MLKDLRWSVRSLLKRPAFTAVAALSLALGIGANTTVFTLAKAIFLKPLPVEDASRLVAVYTTDEQNPGMTVGTSYPNLQDIRRQNDTLDGLAACVLAPLELNADGQSTRLTGLAVGGDYFDVLGVEARRGRTLNPDDTRAPGEGEPVIVLGYGAWERHFGASPDILGKTLVLSRQAFTVVGVMPPAWNGHQRSLEYDVYFPLTLIERVFPSFDPNGEALTSRRFAAYFAVARLAPGSDLDNATADLRLIGQRLEEQYSQVNRGRSFRPIPLVEANLSPNPEQRARARLAMGLLATLVGLVLLIACANVANLLLVQATARGREVAIRLALGSSHRQLVQRFLVESLLLALLGGGLSLFLAPFARDLIVASFPVGLANMGYDLSLDLWVLGFTFGATILTALIFGAIPTWKAIRADVVAELKDLPALGGGGRKWSAGNILVTGQVALSLIALVATGLFVRSLDALRDVDPGFAADELAAVAFDVNLAGYDEERAGTLYRQLAERAAGLPGAVSAVVTDMMPFRGGGFGRTVFREGEEPGSGDGGGFAYCAGVSPEFFDTLGLMILQGRALQATDLPDSEKVVVINEQMAATFWGGHDPIGQRFHFHSLDEERRVVGVVRNFKFFSLNEQPLPAAFYPLSQMHNGSVHLTVRAAGDPTVLLAGMRRLLEESDPDIGWQQLSTMPENIRQSLFMPLTISRLLAVFGAVALTLALIGLFGVISYSVAQRHREIGIHMAIGAQRSDVQGLVLRQGLRLVFTGIGFGLIASWIVGRLVESFLFGVRPTDPWTLTVMPALLIAVAVLAILLPAQRAATVDPVTALKYE